MTTVPILAHDVLMQAHELYNLGRIVDAESMVADALIIYPDNAQLALFYGTLALDLVNHTAALSRFAYVREQFPDQPDGYFWGAETLVRMGRFDEAEAVISPAVRAFPESLNVAMLSVVLAQHRGAHEDALKRANLLKKRFPNVIDGFVAEVSILQRMGSIDLARAALNSASEMFGERFEIVRANAEFAEQQGQLDEALEIWSKYKDQSLVGLDARVRLLLNLKRAEEAKALLDSYAEMLAREDSGMLARLSAMVLQAVGKPKEAAQVLEAHLRIASPQSNLLVFLARLQAESGELNRADVTLRSALMLSPRSLEVQSELARLAVTREDWPNLASILADMKEHFPGVEGVRHLISDAVWHARSAGGAAYDWDSLLSVPDREEIQALVLSFESLCGCEFGLVQRTFGCEPLGLLRWASAQPKPLALGIREGFDGLGNSELTKLYTNNGEYWIEFEKYGIRGHTWTYQRQLETGEFAQAKREKFALEQFRRIKFLGHKLLDDIADGNKIFVYRHPGSVSRDDIANLDGIFADFAELNLAIKSVNQRAALLVVTTDSDADRGPSVECLSENFFHAYIRKSSARDISVDQWISICSDVFARVRGKAQ